MPPNTPQGQQALEHLSPSLRIGARRLQCPARRGIGQQIGPWLQHQRQAADPLPRVFMLDAGLPPLLQG
ncbi:hypothetical protein BME99_12240 [Pseudomonas protegens]|nr:hypothetical protein BME99_12240 [Pseudomonas protegens]